MNTEKQLQRAVKEAYLYLGKFYELVAGVGMDEFASEGYSEDFETMRALLGKVNLIKSEVNRCLGCLIEKRRGGGNE